MIDPKPTEEPEPFNQIKALKLEDIDLGEVWVEKIWLTNKFALVAYVNNGVLLTESVDHECIIDMY